MYLLVRGKALLSILSVVDVCVDGCVCVCIHICAATAIFQLPRCTQHNSFG